MSHTVAVPPASGSPVTIPAYPARRADWLHQFTSLLGRADVAKQIGRDAVLLLMGIAIQEDREQYRSAPVYFDSEVMRMTGIRSVIRLDRVIRIAEEAGWLMAVYPDDDDSVGQYWTLIPQRFKLFETVPELPGKSHSTAEPHDPRQQSPGAAVTPLAFATPEVTQTTTSRQPVTQPAATPVTVTPVVASNDRPQKVTAAATGAPQPVPQRVPSEEGPSHTPRATPAECTVSNKQKEGIAPGSQPAAPNSARTADNFVSGTPSNSNPQAEATQLWQLYPGRKYFEQELPEILRALEKVPFHVLHPLVERYAAEIKQRPRHPILIPTVAQWFQQQTQKQTAAN